jgi:hypothetical protein
MNPFDPRFWMQKMGGMQPSVPAPAAAAPAQ